jgi:hypothetical protein
MDSIIIYSRRSQNTPINPQAIDISFTVMYSDGVCEIVSPPNPTQNLVGSNIVSLNVVGNITINVIIVPSDTFTVINTFSQGCSYTDPDTGLQVFGNQTCETIQSAEYTGEVLVEEKDTNGITINAFTFTNTTTFTPNPNTTHIYLTFVSISSSGTICGDCM